MRKAILLAILPVALAAKREQTSCNESCTKVLQKQQESCPSGSDSSCLCELSDSDYWEPLTDCDCINPDKKLSLKEIKSQICGAPEEPPSSEKQSTSSSSKSSKSSSSSSSSSSSTSTEASSSDDNTPITESAVAAAALQETTTEIAAPVAETTTVPGEAVTETVAGQVETATEVAPVEDVPAEDANTDTVTPSFTELQPVPAQSAPPVILAQPAAGNQTDLSQVTVQAFENGAAARVGIAAGSLFALALNIL